MLLLRLLLADDQDLLTCVHISLTTGSVKVETRLRVILEFEIGHPPIVKRDGVLKIDVKRRIKRTQRIVILAQAVSVDPL